MDKIIKPIERLKGEIGLPGDKSISHRVILIGGISKGKTLGKNFLKAEDCMRTVSAFREMGIDIVIKDKNVTVNGNGLKGLRGPDRDLNLGNSGTTMRILPGILAGQGFRATLTGDESLSKRPMERIIEPLQKMGVDIKSKKQNGFPPLVIKGGGVRNIEYRTNVASAQVKSCVLFAALHAEGISSVTEPLISRDHTERMLEFFGAEISKEKLTTFIKGRGNLEGREIFIPGDVSSASFFIAGACMLEGSDITVRDVGLNPTRLGLLNVLSRMGASIAITEKKEKAEPYGDIRVKYATLKGVTVKKDEIPSLIDEVPVLAVLASRASGKMRIEGIAELRVKETDRVFSVTTNLKKMGVSISVDGDAMVIDGGKGRLKKADLESFNDHRTAMSMALAGLYADGECRLRDTDCVNTSFPEFFDILEHLS